MSLESYIRVIMGILVIAILLPIVHTAVLNTLFNTEFNKPLENIIISSIGSNEENQKWTWDNFHSIEMINCYLDKLETDYNSITNGGVHKIILDEFTFEGRGIFGMKVDIPTPQFDSKKVIYFESGMYGTERLTPMATLYMLHALVDARENEDLYWLARAYIWIFIPVANPDGYDYNYQILRSRDLLDSECASEDKLAGMNVPKHLTRTAHLRHGGECYGADGNRNFDYHWQSAEKLGATPCSLFFPGEYVWSERCVKALADHISSVGPELHAYFSVHQNGPFFVLPYGDRDDHCENYDDMKKILRIVSHRLQKNRKHKFHSGTVKETIVKRGDKNNPEIKAIIDHKEIKGSSIDWVKRTWNPPIVVQVELPDSDVPVEPGEVYPTKAAFIDFGIREALEAFLNILGEYDIMFPDTVPPCPKNCKFCPPWCHEDALKITEPQPKTTKAPFTECPSGCVFPMCPIFCIGYQPPA